MNLDRLHEIPTDAESIMVAARRTLDRLNEEFKPTAEEKAEEERDVMNGTPFIRVTAAHRGYGRGYLAMHVAAAVQCPGWVFLVDPITVIKIYRWDGRLKDTEVARRILQKAGFLNKASVPVKISAA